MNSFLEMMVALMMIQANLTGFTATTTGEHYEPTVVRYDAKSNTTYAVWARYYVLPNGGGTLGRHFQVRPYNGAVSIADLMKDGDERADNNINIVTSLK